MLKKKCDDMGLSSSLPRFRFHIADLVLVDLFQIGATAHLPIVTLWIMVLLYDTSNLSTKLVHGLTRLYK